MKINNVENNDGNIDSVYDDHDKATENECKDLINVLQYNVALGFDNLEGLSEAKKRNVSRYY